MFLKRLAIIAVAALSFAGPLAVSAETTATTTAETSVVVTPLSPEAIFLANQEAQRAAAAAPLTSREKILLAALVLSATVMTLALVALLKSRRGFKKQIEKRRSELKRAFANAYVGMRDGAADLRRVREADQSIERIISDLEHYLD